MKHFSTGCLILVVSAILIFLFRNSIPLNNTSISILGLTTAGIILSLYYYFRPKHDDLISLVNQKIEKTEYSAFLLDKRDEDLTTLQRIQKSKVESAILNNKLKLPFLPEAIYAGSSLAGLLMLALFSISANTTDIQKLDEQTNQEVEYHNANIQSNVDTINLKDVSIKITPPSYTQLSSSFTKNLALNIPEGSRVNWHFDISGTPDRKEIIFEDKEVHSLNSANNYSRSFNQSSYYNYRLVKQGQNEISSDYFPIKVIEDQKPKIEINGVEEYQRLEYAENHDINFKITASDDHGLTDLLISSTLAKGTGEAVKFREKQTALKDLLIGSKNYNGSYMFSTKELGMEPGDELYFYVAAKDNCPFENHWSKSTTYFVVLEDTVQVSLVDVGGMQMDLMPDFFRSQRQIIIDTEKLISEKDTLPVEVFKQRSNELGYDQKLLRLKYGQFLGEEAESGLDFDNDVDLELEGGEHDHSDPNHVHEDEGSKALNEARSLIDQFMHDHDHEEEEGQLMATKGTEKIEEAKNPQWVKDMSHSHDNTEEATFFDVSIKGKLRAALNEMWDAELHLRLFDPAKSLPYQYKSLSFLDEVKNHARAYVQRIGFDPPAIKEQEKRLTGELKEVYSTRDILKANTDNLYVNLKAALPIILDLQQDQTKLIAENEKLTLQKAGSELSQIALSRSEYLPVLTLMRSLVDNKTNLTNEDFILLIKGITQILPADVKDVVGEKYYRHPINMKVISEFKKVL